MSREQEQGCRSGRQSRDERLAARDRERHEIREQGMKGVGNWPTGGRKP